MLAIFLQINTDHGLVGPSEVSLRCDLLQQLDNLFQHAGFPLDGPSWRKAFAKKMPFSPKLLPRHMFVNILCSPRSFFEKAFRRFFQEFPEFERVYLFQFPDLHFDFLPGAVDTSQLDS